MDNTDAAFATNLTNQTKTHEEWLAVMRFGMSTLLQDQIILVECVFTEAQREKERNDKPCNQQDVSRIAWEIFSELDLKVVADA